MPAPRIAGALIEWLPCLPCLFWREALTLYMAAALVSLAALGCLGRYAGLAARLQRQVQLFLALTAGALAAQFASSWLLAPESSFPTLSLLAALCMVPLLHYPSWILVALCTVRSLGAGFTPTPGRAQAPR